MMNDKPLFTLFHSILSDIPFYLDLIRGDHPTSFTRHRKIQISDLIYQMLTRRGQSQWSELMEFYDHSGKTKEITEQGFYLARKKLNPEAIRVMGNNYIANYYDNEDDSFRKFKDCLVLAIDGSKFVVPNTEENIAVFGQTQGKKDTPQPAMALLSTLHDSLNNLKLDVLVDRVDANERELASKHIEHFQNFYTQKAIFTFDRGYPSIRLLDQIQCHSQYFLFRCSATDYTQYFNSLSVGEDRVFEVSFDTASTNTYRHDIRFRQHLLNTVFSIRFTKIQIGEDSDGEPRIELLMSNLPLTDFTTEELKNLYHLRWDTETSYNRLKNRMKMEEFSGYKANLILQDVYADVWLYNVISLQLIYVNERKPIDQKNGQYTLKRNFNKAVGTMKKLLLKALLHPDPLIQRQAIEQIGENIESQLVWVKNEDRSFQRRSSVNHSDLSYRKTY